MKNPISYSSRAWLSDDTHSSAFVMCYYNPECLNNHWEFFLRIADCNDIFHLVLSRHQKRTMVKHIRGIVAVINRTRSSYTVRTGTRSFKITIESLQNQKSERFLIVENSSVLSKPVCHILLHYDDETCTLEQWNKKLQILSDELEKFKEFLLSIV